MSDVDVYRDPRMKKEMKKIIKSSSAKISVVVDGVTQRVDIKK